MNSRASDKGGLGKAEKFDFFHCMLLDNLWKSQFIFFPENVTNYSVCACACIYAVYVCICAVCVYMGVCVVCACVCIHVLLDRLVPADNYFNYVKA